MKLKPLPRFAIDDVVTQQTDTMDEGEGRRSIDQHIAVMKWECQKMWPNQDIICQNLQKIQKYRAHYIHQQTT